MSELQLEKLDLNLLLALHWILTERNITAAASKIGVSQPAASRALSRLREVFDDPLIVRSGNTMVPTRTGEKLQPAIALAIERCREVLNVNVIFDPATQEGRFRVACIDYVGASLVKAWEAAIRPNAPKMELDIVNLDPSAGLGLISGKIDLVIIPHLDTLDISVSYDLEQFVMRKVSVMDYSCAIRKGHPLGNQKLTLKQYLNYEHILISPQGGELGFVDDVLDNFGHRRKIAYRPYSFLMALPILQHTDCIITAPKKLLELEKSRLRIMTPPIETPSHDFVAGWHPNWTNDERHKWVRDRLFDAF